MASRGFAQERAGNITVGILPERFVSPPLEESDSFETERSSVRRGQTVAEIVADARSDDFSGGRSSNAQRGGSSASTLSGSLNSAGTITTGSLEHDFNARDLDLTVTTVITRDVFTTFTNVFYNTIPVTLTEFLKTTRVAQTQEVSYIFRSACFTGNSNFLKLELLLFSNLTI